LDEQASLSVFLAEIKVDRQVSQALRDLESFLESLELYYEMDAVGYDDTNNVRLEAPCLLICCIPFHIQQGIVETCKNEKVFHWLLNENRLVVWVE